MDTREPRDPKRVVVLKVVEPPKPIDWSVPKTLDSERARSFILDDVRRLIGTRGSQIGQDGPEGAALLAALNAYANARRS